MKSKAHQVLAFAQVMRDGSFSAAARNMGVTQSALSQHVAKLEQHVGARLIMRGSNGLELTHAGADLFDLAEQYASLSQEIDERLSGYGALENGQLNIIANAPQPAMSCIAQYGRIYPNVGISFTLVDWTRTMSMLSEHRVDLAFITQPRQNRDCIYKKLCETDYVLYASADHPFAKKQSVSLRDLETETLILPETGSLTQKVVAEAMAAHHVEPRRKLITTTFPVMKEAILNGIGVGIFLAEAASQHQSLVQRPIEELSETFEIYAAVPKKKIGLRLVKSFWDQLDGVPR